jgi:hypothetical protein
MTPCLIGVLPTLAILAASVATVGVKNMAILALVGNSTILSRLWRLL